MYSFIKKQKQYIAFGAFFLFLFAAFVLCPLTVDDTYYKYLNMNSFKEIFNFAAGYGNGRVLGNMGGMFFACHTVAGAFVRSLISTGIFALLYYLTKTGKEKTDALILVVELLAFVGMGSTLFGGTFAWQSAFFNTVPPIFLLLLNIAIIKKYQESSKHKAFYLVAVVFFAFIAQFFSENSTLYSCAFFLMVIVANGIHFKKPQLPYVLGLISSIIGAGGMIAVRRFYPLVERAFADVKEYQQIHLNGIYDALKFAFASCLYLMRNMSGFVMLLLILSIEMLLIISKNDFKSEKLNKFKPFLKLFCLIFTAYTIMSRLFSIVDFVPNIFAYVHVVAIWVVYLMYLLVIVATCTLIKNKKTRIAFSFTMLFALGNLVPVLIVSPRVIRLLIYTYFFVMISELILLREIAEYIPLKYLKKFCTVAVVLVVIISSYIVTIYGNCLFMKKNLVKICREEIANGADEIEVCGLTDIDYFHAVGLDDTYMYELYRDKPGDVKFKEITPKEWEDKIIKMQE